MSQPALVKSEKVWQ